MRSIILATLFLTIALSAAALLYSQSDRNSASESRELNAHPASNCARASAPPSAPLKREEGAVSPTQVAELSEEADRLEAMARYPQWSQPLDLIGDPIAAAEFDVPAAQSADMRGGEAILAVRAERASFVAPSPVVLHARLVETAISTNTSVTASVIDGLSGPVMQVHFTLDQSPGAAGPSYVASFVPPLRNRASAGYTVRVVAVTSDGAQHSATLEVIYSRPSAKLTGRFRDRIDAGDLVIDAEVMAEEPSRVQLDGSIYSADATRQVAWASATSQAVQGTTWLPLRFHGLVLRDQQVSGPYLLRYVSVTAQTSDADAHGVPLENAYLTGPYEATAFSGDVANDAELLNEAAMLRERIAKLQNSE